MGWKELGLQIPVQHIQLSASLLQTSRCEERFEPQKFHQIFFNANTKSVSLKTDVCVCARAYVCVCVCVCVCGFVSFDN